MDSIDNFFNQNRHLLDDADPPEGHEKRFHEKMGLMLAPRRRYLNIWVNAAASVAILISLGLWMASVAQNPTVKQFLSQTNPELQEMNTYYQGEVFSKIQVFEANKKMDPGIGKEVHSEIKEIEQSRQSLLENYLSNPGNERILNEIVNSYRLQIEVLNQAINLLHQTKDDNKNLSHESKVS
ncbi:MAG TPA: hypothetical protein VMW01_08585 [Williamwhitmania sp.]|jgi:hypothetical protein|nr:hypothetical protein [Williamwhitmania sp.]